MKIFASADVSDFVYNVGSVSNRRASSGAQQDLVISSLSEQHSPEAGLVRMDSHSWAPLVPKWKT